MLHRPSKAVMAPIAEAVGTLAGTLTQPFISRDVGYVQDDPGQKSRKVRNHMLKSPFKSVIARAATFALVLSLAIAFATVGLAPSASAQQADGPSCEADTDGETVTCTYDEGLTVPVASFSAPDPEGNDVEWDLNGPDASKFTIDGGVLEFKSSPNFEDPNNADKSFTVIVRATEVLDADDAGPAKYSHFTVTVNIQDVDDPGSVTFDYKQPQADVMWKATFKDEDSGAESGASSEWSVPKVSRPAIDNDDHWTAAAGTGQTSETFAPDESIVGEILRVKVTYSDTHGDDKEVYAKTDVGVRAAPTGTTTPPAFTDANGFRSVNEAAKSGTHVGNPATATVGTDLPLFTYRLVTSVSDTTTAYAGPFTIDAKTGQIKVSGELVDADATTTDLTAGGPTYGNHDEEANTPDVWYYDVYVMARNPSGVENDGDGTPERADPFRVRISVREVNEKPALVVQMDDPDTTARTPSAAPDTFSYDIMIDENHPLKNMLVDHDDDGLDEDGNVNENASAERIEAPASVFFEIDDTETLGEDGRVTVYTFSATDVDADDAATTADSDAVTGSVKRVKLTLAGDDRADFTLYEVNIDADDDGDFEDSGDTRGRYELRFKGAKPNFEAPMDANKDNRYEVSVVATDDEGLASMKDLTIRVMNEKEDGKVKLSTNQPAVDFAVTATLTDPDNGATGLKWQWQSSKTSGGTFTNIPGATSDTYMPKAAVKDVESTTNIDETDPGDEGMFLKAVVTYTDNASDEDDPDSPANESLEMRDAVSEHAVRVEPDVNSDPVFDAGITREVVENTKEDGTVGGPVRATDPDGDTLSYTITGGADEKAFKIDSDGQIRVGKGTKLDYEGGQRTYEVEVTATDPFDASDSTMVTIMVTDMNEKPDLGLAVQQADEPSCEADTAGETVTCSYDERLEVPVVNFSAPDPEGNDVEWELNGADASKFTIDGGVLEFKDSPNFEASRSPTYNVTVIATEVLDANDSGPAKYEDVEVTVNVEDVDDPGKITFDYKQPQAGVMWKATFKDEDSGADAGVSFEWSVPKVSRPAIDNDDHWTAAAADSGNNTSETYTPAESVVGEILRVKVTYSDVHGDDKEMYEKTDVGVRAAPTGTVTPPAFTDANGFRSVNETAKSGTHVGNPATATKGTDLTLFTYRLVTSVSDTTTAYAGPFTIEAKTGQIKVSGELVDADATTTTLTAGDPTNGDHDAEANTPEVWYYDVYVMARNPSDVENDGVGTPERADPFRVRITVREVNEKPAVAVQMDDPETTVAPEASTDFADDRMIGENHPLKDMLVDHDDDGLDEDGNVNENASAERIETPANVNFEVDDTVTLGNNARLTVYTFIATDVDADDADTNAANADVTGSVKRVKLSLAGDDMADFKLMEVDDGDDDDATSSGRYELRFKSSKPNFEAPMDANKDNRYEVSVVATDDEGLASMKDLTIRVMNEKEDGKVKLSTNQPAVDFAVTATLTDPDGGATGLKWQWQSSKTSGGTFTNIPGATSDTYMPKAAVKDVESTTNIDETDPGDEGMFLKAVVTYTDNASDEDDPDSPANESLEMRDAVSEHAVRVEPDVNSDPVFDAGITREVVENTKEDGTVGGPVRATDPDGDTLSYTITGGADEKAFKIDSDGQIRVGKGTELDYESGQRTYEVEVTATDPFDASDSTMVTIMVTDMNEGPTLSLGGGSTPPSAGVVGGREYVSVREGTSAVGTYTTTIEDPSSWTLSGPDADDFSIGDGGELSFSSAPDYEAPTDANTDNVYMVTVEANNGNGGAELDVTVTVTNDPSDDQTTTPGEFDPNSYDTDGDGSISKDEVLDAIDDYFDGMITKEQVLDVIDLYFGS